MRCRDDNHSIGVGVREHDRKQPILGAGQTDVEDIDIVLYGCLDGLSQA